MNWTKLKYEAPAFKLKKSHQNQFIQSKVLRQLKKTVELSEVLNSTAYFSLLKSMKERCRLLFRLGGATNRGGFEVIRTWPYRL